MMLIMKHQILGRGNFLIKISRDKFLVFSTNDHRSSKKIDSSGRPVKGRGFMVLLYSFY